MLFRKTLWPGIENGSVTVAFRRWRRPTVKAGGTLHSPAGLLAIDSIVVVDPATITADDALRAGYTSLGELATELWARTDGEVYRIEFHRHGDDPRVALRNDGAITGADVAEIAKRLARLDAASRHGPWTAAVLCLIAENPGRRAPDLAAELSHLSGVERTTQPFKNDVRKLKSLGLTESLVVGYRLSPRGIAYRAAISGDD